MDNGHGHQLAKSAKQSSSGHYKGGFTWTMAVAISWPGQHQGVAIATIKETYMDNGRGPQLVGFA